MTQGDQDTMSDATTGCRTAKDFDGLLTQNVFSLHKTPEQVRAGRTRIINDFRGWLIDTYGLRHLPEGVTYLAFQMAWASHGDTEEVYAAFSDYAQLLHGAYEAGRLAAAGSPQGPAA